MPGLGTVINVVAVLGGATVGVLLKGGLPKRFQEVIISGIGLITMFIGLSGSLVGLLGIENDVLVTKNTMIMIGSLIIGALVGEWINIEKRLDQLGDWCKSLVKAKNEESGGTFVEGFVTSSLLFCVGAMAIVGALEDGLNHNYTVLFTKSVLDGIMAIIFTASLGIGVYFSAASILIYQGSITLLAGIVRPYLSELVIGQMSFVGSILIFALGINLIFGKKIKIGNLLPAMFVPLLYQGIVTILR